MTFTQVIAHRGSKGTHPENTLPAFLHAVNNGADGIELDVQLSKDGELMVIHDETIDRTTNGKGYVHQQTSEELKRLDAGAWFAPEYAGIQIPTLTEVLETMAEQKFMGTINIELKTDRFSYSGIEEKILEATRKTDWPFRLVFSSFNEDTLFRLLEMDPAISAAYLFKTPGQEKLYAKGRHLFSAWHPKMSWLKQAPLSKMNQLPLRVWTVNKERDMKECFRLEVEAIITDFPEQALEARKKYQ